MPIEKLEPKDIDEPIESYESRVAIHAENVARHGKELRDIRNKIDSLSENSRS